MTRSIDPEGLSRPEASVDQRLKKRLRAAIKRRGLCAFCLLRDASWGAVHCKGFPDRQMGACKYDGKLPAFRLDDSTLEELRDAA